MTKHILAAMAAVLIAFGAGPIEAKTLRWASAGDVLTLDPHAQDENLVNGMLSQIYESLVTRDKQMKVVPALAVSWSNAQPTVWRFKLRQGVKFHDGTPFTADDVVFSIERAKVDGSDMKTKMGSIKEVKKVDDHTV